LPAVCKKALSYLGLKYTIIILFDNAFKMNSCCVVLVTSQCRQN
jgi:hypothetical protein